jgi:hypothetical protein
MSQPPDFIEESFRRSRERQGLPLHITDPRIVQAVRAVLSGHADRLAREAAAEEESQPRLPRRRAS